MPPVRSILLNAFRAGALRWPRSSTRATWPSSGIEVRPTPLGPLGLPALPAPLGESLVPHWSENCPVTDRAIFGGRCHEGLDRTVMLRTRRWKLARYDEGGWELYGRERDPDELQSMHDHSDFRAEFNRMKEQLQAWDRIRPHREPHCCPRAERDNWRAKGQRSRTGAGDDPTRSSCCFTGRKSQTPGVSPR